MKIILASKSPRRKELLSLIGVDYTVMTEDIDETMVKGALPEDEVARLSREKAAAVGSLTDAGDIVISADTVVVLDGEIMGKPKSDADAKRMLKSLSGREHRVMTGFTVTNGERSVSKTVITKINFRKLTDREIDCYIATGEPFDKAGAYGIQGRASVFVSGIEGDYFNVMGLPVCELATVLKSFGVPVMNDTEI